MGNVLSQICGDELRKGNKTQNLSQKYGYFYVTFYFKGVKLFFEHTLFFVKSLFVAMITLLRNFLKSNVGKLRKIGRTLEEIRVAIR